MQDIRDIKISIDTDVVKKIFWNADNAKEYLSLLWYESKALKKLATSDIYGLIVSTWDYSKAVEIIRSVFQKTNKYQEWKKWDESVMILLKEWYSLNFWLVSWPFSQGDFDWFVQRINAEKIDRLQKDEKVKSSAVRYRRIKELNTTRNDFLETLIFDKNNNIIPTLSHSRGVDFFIDWISFDQKVAKSPTTEFKKDFWEDIWKEKAKENPEKVAEYLYQYQDEGRFWAWPRLYVVYLDEDVSPLRIKSIIDSVDLNEPTTITFTYKHKDSGLKTYQTQAFIILLHN